jgi:hypothetical protein
MVPGFVKSQKAYANHMQMRCKLAPAVHCVVSQFSAAEKAFPQR